MILVLASRSDENARSLVDRWERHGARLLVPESLSVVGWRHCGSARPSSRAVLGGAAVDVAEIRGALSRLPSVMPSDLPHIRAEDRPYVAAEMTAFLLAWLASLPCPVLNRPTATSLAGPSLRQEQWVRRAVSAGVPVASVRRTTLGYAPPPSSSLPGASVVVVGDDCIGAASTALAERARKVARSAGVSLLNAYFTGPPDDPLFVSADVWVDLSRPAITDAVLALLLRGGAPSQEVS